MSKKKSNLRGKILFNFMVVLAGIAVLIFIFRNNPVVYPYFSKLWPEKLSIADSGKFQSDNVSATVMCNEKLVYYDTDTLYNEDGWSYKLKMSSPKLKASGACLLAESIAENKCEVFSGFKHIYTIEETNGIILSDISASGNSIIVSREPGYRCKVTVYDKKGENVFRAFFGEKHITDVALSDDGKKLALCLLDIGGDEIVSTVSFYDTDKKDPYAETEDRETAFASIHFYHDGTAIAVGDKKAMGFKKSGEASWQYSYNNASLQHYSFGTQKTVLCLKKGDQQIVTLDSDGTNFAYSHNQADIKSVESSFKDVYAYAEKLELSAIVNRDMIIAGEVLNVNEVFAV